MDIHGDMKVGPRNYRYFVCLLIATYSAPASAYLDPGTGSLLIQGIIASIAAAAAAARLYWHRIVGLFRGKKQADEIQNGDNVDDSSK